MLGAEPMTVPHSGIQYAHPWSWNEPGGLFRLAASACVVMPIAAQTTAIIAIVRATDMLSPVVGPASGGLTNQTRWIDVAQPKNHTGREVQLRFVGPCPLRANSGHFVPHRRLDRQIEKMIQRLFTKATR